MNRKNIVKTIAKSFSTILYNATRLGVNQILMAIILLSISEISRICKIATFSGNGFVKTLHKLDKATYDS